MMTYPNILKIDFHSILYDQDKKFAVSYKQISGKSIRPVITTLFPGSVTTNFDENPGFRVYEIDSVVCW